MKKDQCWFLIRNILVILVYLTTLTNEQDLFSRPQNLNTPSKMVYEKIYTTVDDKDQIILLLNSNSKKIIKLKKKINQKIILDHLELQLLEKIKLQEVCIQYLKKMILMISQLDQIKMNSF